MNKAALISIRPEWVREDHERAEDDRGAQETTSDGRAI